MPHGPREGRPQIDTRPELPLGDAHRMCGGQLRVHGGAYRGSPGLGRVACDVQRFGQAGRLARCLEILCRHPDQRQKQGPLDFEGGLCRGHVGGGDVLLRLGLGDVGRGAVPDPELGPGLAGPRLESGERSLAQPDRALGAEHVEIGRGHAQEHVLLRVLDAGMALPHAVLRLAERRLVPAAAKEVLGVDELQRLLIAAVTAGPGDGHRDLDGAYRGGVVQTDDGESEEVEGVGLRGGGPDPCAARARVRLERGQKGRKRERHVLVPDARRIARGAHLRVRPYRLRERLLDGERGGRRRDG